MCAHAFFFCDKNECSCGFAARKNQRVYGVLSSGVDLHIKADVAVNHQGTACREHTEAPSAGHSLPARERGACCTRQLTGARPVATSRTEACIRSHFTSLLCSLSVGCIAGQATDSTVRPIQKLCVLMHLDPRTQTQVGLLSCRSAALSAKRFVHRQAEHTPSRSSWYSRCATHVFTAPRCSIYLLAGSLILAGSGSVITSATKRARRTVRLGTSGPRGHTWTLHKHGVFPDIGSDRQLLTRFADQIID
jgi:hypothetical protein